MNNGFSQMVAILVAVSLFFFLPLIYVMERTKMASQMYLLTESMELVDSVCNTGFLTGEMYDTFLKKVSQKNELYEIEFLHETKNYVLNETGDFEVFSEFYDEKDILNALEKENEYDFQKNDFLKIIIRKTSKGLFDWYEPEQSILVYYGGMIRYENY